MNRLREPDADLLGAIASALGPTGVVAPEDAGRYLDEPRGLWPGRCALVARPDTVEAVAAVVRLCAQARVGVVPRSGGTGLVGGATLGDDGPRPIVLSTERLRRVRSVSSEDDAMTLEAGVTLAEARAAAEAAGRLFPLSLASEGSARIGGVLATNAGGVAVLRYGNARELCLGVEAVLPTGAIVHGLKALRKDNAGLDMRHLLIGSEGTLGVITAATLRMVAPPAERATALLAVGSPAEAVRLLRDVQAALGDAVTACELMCRQGMAFLAETIPNARSPLGGDPAWLVLLEAGAAGVAEPFAAALARALEAGVASDAVVAASEAQRRALWRLREETPSANRKIGAVASHDVSTPISRLPEFVARARVEVDAVEPRLRVNAFGHVGDGNLHYNVFAPTGETAAAWRPRAAEISARIYDLAAALGGSFAAEHGVGRAKAARLARLGDPATQAAARAIKAALDPNGVMNPGAVLAPM